MKKLKILELTNFSAGACGVWTRVLAESRELKKLGYNVMIFSSQATKGSDKVAPSEDIIEGIEIKRFSFKKMGGESFMSWKFEEEALKFKPDIIIAHVYRHPHTTKALKLAKKINAKCFLVTHAPFIEGNFTRSRLSKIAIQYYDSVLGPSRKLNQFDKVIAITKWERPHLLALSINPKKIRYIPNGIPQQFFIQKLAKEENKVLFFGRISPIKGIETLIEAFAKIKDKKISLEIVGPAEAEYLSKLKQLVKSKHLENRIIFSEPIFNMSDKIKKLDSAKIFVLPSKRDAMPQSLIEAMSRKKLVISSSSQGGREIISNKENGLLFNIGSSEQLSEAINFSLDPSNKTIIEKIKKQARKSVQQYSWDELGKVLEKTILEA
ncbi:MAG: glycosyltransferase family 4 protein [Candidatus Pacearchaeota archaeon]|jgi:hypothetical protein